MNLKDEHYLRSKFGQPKNKSDSDQKIWFYFVLAIIVCAIIFFFVKTKEGLDVSRTEKIINEFIDDLQNPQLASKAGLDWAEGKVVDKWGQPIVIDTINEMEYCLYSLGKDKVKSADDIHIVRLIEKKSNNNSKKASDSKSDALKFAKKLFTNFNVVE